MPSLFPYFLTYQQLGPFILRLVLGVTLAWFGYKKIKGKGDSSGSNSTKYGGVEIFVAIFLIIGLYTQLAAMINAIILIVKIGYKIREKKFLTNGVNYYVLLLAIAISLIFSGAGFFAFDLPL